MSDANESNLTYKNETAQYIICNWLLYSIRPWAMWNFKLLFECLGCATNSCLTRALVSRKCINGLRFTIAFSMGLYNNVWELNFNFRLGVHWVVSLHCRLVIRIVMCCCQLRNIHKNIFVCHYYITKLVNYMGFLPR